MAEGDDDLGGVFRQDALQFFSAVKNDEVRMNMACERTEVQGG